MTSYNISKQNTLERALSYQRLDRYDSACKNNAKLAIILYELNSYLSVSLFRAIGIFEVTFRSATDKLYSEKFGNRWLEESIKHKGMFDTFNCEMTNKAIKSTLNQLKKRLRRINKNHIIIVI